MLEVIRNALCRPPVSVRADGVGHVVVGAAVGSFNVGVYTIGKVFGFATLVSFVVLMTTQNEAVARYALAHLKVTALLAVVGVAAAFIARAA